MPQNNRVHGQKITFEHGELSCKRRDESWGFS